MLCWPSSFFPTVVLTVSPYGTTSKKEFNVLNSSHNIYEHMATLWVYFLALLSLKTDGYGSVYLQCCILFGQYFPSCSPLLALVVCSLFTQSITAHANHVQWITPISLVQIIPIWYQPIHTWLHIIAQLHDNDISGQINTTSVPVRFPKFVS